MALSNPQELAQRQITFVAFLLERWAVKLEISSTPVVEEKGLLPLVADLAGERCPSRGDLKAAEPRFLDTRKLAKSLRNRVGLLRRGESPAKLALGEDCVQPSCEQLLVYLFRQWCQMRPAAPERSAARRAHVCTEVAAIHHYISGGAAQRTVDHTKLTQTQRLELETLGRIRTAPDEEYSNAHGFMLESWQLDDDSPLELRIRRAAGTAGKRYSHGQLVAVRPAEGKAFHVGQVRWLLCAADGELRAGIKLFPGAPSGVTLRGVGLNETERSLFGLSLAAVASAQAPATLVLPMGTFKPGRVLEVQGGKPRSVRLTELAERGADFDRVAYEPA
jgi:cyclic-di-GMP-binding protein